MRIFVIAFVGVALLGCGNPEELRAEKIAKLDAMRRETLANLVRQKGECQAVAVEFNGDAQMVQSCLETHRMLVEMAQRTLTDIDKRLAEIESTGR